MLAEYLYAEYAEYIQLLASMREVDGIGRVASLLSFALVMKNVFVGGSVVAYVLYEVRLAKRGRIRRAASNPWKWLASATRLWPTERGRTAVLRQGSASPDVSKGDPASGHRDARANAPDVSNETSSVDDGFDFLRDGRKLRTRAEKLIHSE